VSTLKTTNIQNISATSPAIVLAADGTATAKVSAINNGPLAGFRNAIINGNFDIWQRGTSQSVSGVNSADRWRPQGPALTSFSRQSFTLGQNDVPSEPIFYSRTVVTSNFTSSSNCALQQRLESVRSFAGQQVTISFWAKADSTKNIAIECGQFFGTGGSPSPTVRGLGVLKTQVTTLWQKISHTFTMLSISGKTIGSDGNDYVFLNIWFDGGSDFDAFNDSLGQQSGTFDIAQVQLEAGPVATPFERRPIGTELALCQRYFEVGEFFHVEGYFLSAGTNTGSSIFFATRKRAVPTVTQTTIAVSGAAPITAQNAAASLGGFLSFRTGSSASSGQYHESWTADAEL
jgi:hypothetical protein